MAAASVNKDGEVNKGIDSIELRYIDLRHFGENELRLVAQFSGHFPEASFTDIVVPTIDKSCFNESAGSRRQTWSNRGKGKKHSDRSMLGSSATTTTTVIHRRSIGLTTTTVQTHNTGELTMPDAETRFRTAKAIGRLKANRKVTVKSSARQVAWKRAITRGVTNVVAKEKFATNGEIRGPVGGVAGTVREGLSRKRLRQPIEAFTDDEEIARRRNKRRSRSSAARRGLGEEVLVGAKRGRGLLFGGRQLEFHQRPERAQKRRIREGDMIGRLAKMKGKWASIEKTRKIVDASGFPVGWTVRVGLRYKDGRILFEYRDWRSPDGTLWSSFQDASAFLLSSIGHDSTSKIVVLVKPGGGTIGDEGISSPKKENTIETLGKGNVYGGLYHNKVPRVDWNQSVGGFSNVDKIPDLTGAVTRVEIVSYVDELQAEDFPREIVNKAQTQGSGQSACLLERQSCGDHMTKTEDSPKNVDLKTLTRISDKISNVAVAATTGVEMASHMNELQAEGCHREILDKEQTQQSEQSACLLERHSYANYMTKAEDPSKNADLKESPRISQHESTSGMMETSINSGHSKSMEGQCRSHLTPSSAPSSDSGHKCPSCGLMFSTLMKLRAHLKRVKNGRQLNCNVCGRYFSSIALLLSHRVQMGHPRVSRITSDSRRLKAQRLEPFSRPRGSKISNIVVGLLADDNDGIGVNVDHLSIAAASSSKSIESPSSRDAPKVVKKEVTQKTEKNGDLSGVFECETCNKVFYRRSQYWGHQSVHAKERKRALKSNALLESVFKRSVDTAAGSESNLSMVGKENCGYEAGSKYAVKSVLWSLLDCSSALERPNYELGIVQDEAVKPPALHSKEEGWKFSDGTQLLI